jgi:hypothetical protein
MSYNGSLSFSGEGSVLAINTGTVGTPVWTTINEVMDASISGRVNKTSDVTNFSSGGTEEFIVTIQTPGDIKTKLNYVTTDAGQGALFSAFSSRTKTMFKLTLPLSPSQTATGDVLSFSGVVTEWSLVDKFDSPITVDTNIKISGAIVTTSGS